MMNRLMIAALALVLVPAMGTTALGVGLNSTIVNVDLDVSAAGTQTTATWAPGSTNETHLVLEAQQAGQMIDGLTGVSADLEFDHTKLTLVDVYELKGDINFDGFQDVGDLSTLFQADAYETCDDEEAFIRYYDLNADTCIDVGDLSTVFQSNMYETGGFPYWTNNEENHVRESVEIFDAPSLSNTGGENEGFVDDLVSVLLLRPDNGSGQAADGSGYDTAEWSGERAIICSLVWQVKQAAPAGETVIAVVANDESGTTKNAPVAINKSTADVNNPEKPAAGSSTVNIQ